MVTFKQLEALHWVCRLGTFGSAATKLNTTESAISKRIAELERFFGVELFDRSRRTARPTAEGRKLLELAADALGARDRLLEQMGRESAVVRRFRIGVTELVALTWLPRLVQTLRTQYPDVLLEPEIDLSTQLCQKLELGQLDLVIVPPVFQRDGSISAPLQEMKLSWMCRPGLVRRCRRVPLAEVARHPILMQIGGSGVDVVVDRWLRHQGLSIRRLYAGNSLVALGALTASGFGVSFLPALYFHDHVERGILQTFETEAALPPIRYYAVYRNEGGASSFNAKVARLCVDHCDFSRPRLDASDDGRRARNR
ncbi:MAG: LysR family transcriptional regulator [Burkholderiales bacterium]|nr:LysR family transcriptional regulator [Burkholderiales bacterium]MCE7876147.1 LysR family transcriptional regulator [Betaproteobacteria bacterium PRO3]